MPKYKLIRPLLHFLVFTTNVLFEHNRDLSTCLHASLAMVRCPNELKKYVHSNIDNADFNLRGSKKIANLLSENVLTGYSQFKFLRIDKKALATIVLENNLTQESTNENL